MSLVLHKGVVDKSRRDISLVHWTLPSLFKGNIVRVRDGKLIAMTPMLNPVRTFDVEEVLMKDTRPRGNVRTDKYNRFDAPEGAMRMKLMWESAMVARAPLICQACEEPIGDPTDPGLFTCYVCLLSWHLSCNDDCCAEARMHRRFSEYESLEVPAQLMPEHCKLCSFALKVCRFKK